MSTAPSPIVTSAIDKLAQQLSNLGCVFTIMHAGEVVHDTMPRQAPERQRKPRRNFESTGLYEPIKTMQPGEVVRIPVPEGYKANDIQSVLSARLVGLYGKGSFMTQQVAEGAAVDVLRMS